MRNKPFYSPVATRYRDFDLTTVLSRIDGAFVTHGCIVRSIDGDEIFRVEVHQVCPDLEAAHAKAIEAGKRRIDDIFGAAG
jgi:acyl-CoA thioesterase FadM